MLKTTLIHPEILRVVARAGHHAKILIADGHYPASTKRGPNAELISLNLSPGVVTCAQVLRALLSAVPVDHVNTMGIPPDDPYAKHGEPPVWKEYRAILDQAPVPAVRLNPDLPPKLEDIINRAMEKDRNLRYQHASDIAPISND